MDGAGARLAPADDVWGLPAAEAERGLVASLGRGWRVASIGPAGERGVRFATVSHDGRHAGRGGLGAVMGAKNLKAVAVHAATRVAPADPEGVLAAARDLRARSFGPATAKYRELGTLANLLAFNAIHTLPTRNFTAATFAEAPRLAAEDLTGLRRVARNSCASCTIGCEHIFRGHGSTTTRVEYENVFALGPLCGVSDPDTVLEASARCDALGLDTISAGGTIAWAMECADRGLLDAPWLRFGDGTALLRALDEIGRREGLGALLAEGSRRAAASVGAGSEDFALQVKGLELPGYEPRTLQAMALGLAVNARGADHNRSGAYEADLSGDLDRFAGGQAHVLAAVETEDRAAVMDSMILCKFLRGRLHRPVPRVGGPAADGHRLGPRRRGAARHGAPDRPGQADVQPARGLGAGRRLAAGPAAAGARDAGLRPGGHAVRRDAARHGRRLLGRPWPGRAGASAQRGRRRRPPAG